MTRGRPVGLLVAVGLLAAGCRAARPAPSRIPGPLGSTLLALAAELGTPASELPSTWTSLEGISRQVLEDAPGREASLPSRLRVVLFDALRFEREVDADGLEFVLLPAVVAARRGNCVGLGALYLALAEQLGLEAHGVLVPGHFFVRVSEDGKWRNVELLRRGESLPDAWYVERYGPWSPDATAYLRPLSISELVGVHWFNAGNARRRAGDLAGAERAFGRAVAEFPGFAEASASLGMTRQLRGDRAGAAAAYQGAARARPDLPGLAHNIQRLEHDRVALDGAAADHDDDAKKSSPSANEMRTSAVP